MTVRTGGGTVFGYVRVTTAVRLALRPVLAACNQCEHTGHPEPPNPLAKGCGQRAQIDPP
jgi:hypothetical protein